MQAAKDATLLLILILVAFSLKVSPAPDAGVGWHQAEAATAQKAALLEDGDPAESGDPAAQELQPEWVLKVEQLQQRLEQELRTEGLIPEAVPEEGVEPEFRCGEEIPIPKIVVIRKSTKV